MGKLTDSTALLNGIRQISMCLYYIKPNGQSALAGIHQFQHPTWMRFLEGIVWMPRGKQYLPLCHQSPNLVSYHHDVTSMLFGKVSRERCLVLSKGCPLMSCSPLSKAEKPVWAYHLARMPCLVIYIKVEFVHPVKGFSDWYYRTHLKSCLFIHCIPQLFSCTWWCAVVPDRNFAKFKCFSFSVYPFIVLLCMPKYSFAGCGQRAKFN